MPSPPNGPTGEAQVSREAPGAPSGGEQPQLALASVEEELGLWDWNMRTGELLVSRRWLELLGRAEGEVALHLDTWRKLCHPEDLPELERRMRELQEGLRPRDELEYRLRHDNGSWVWVLDRAKVVAWDERGQPLRTVGIQVDITASKRHAERMRALAQAIPDLLFRVHVDGTILDFKASNLEELVLPPESLIGSNLGHLPPPFDEIMERVGRAIREGVLEVFEYALDLPQGRQCYEARIVRGGPDEAVCIVRNITERKLAEARLRQQEEELRRHRDHLEELVHSRTESLLQATHELEQRQAQLVQSEKMASLGQMAAGVAHEINNPVSYVMSNLRTLEQYVSSLTTVLRLQRELLATQEGLPGPVASLLGRMRELWKQEEVDHILGDLPELLRESQEGNRRIKDIVQSLRTFARADSGEMRLVNLNEELESTLKMVWNELKYTCEVKRDFGPLPPVHGHSTQLSQVFTNLLLNASQAIETRGEVHITTRQEGDEVVVRISDTGHGMTPETLSRLFTPFFTTKPHGKGTGLGLSISYGIITRHKGRIEVRSEPGKGTTFTVRLPAVRG